jgi:hypothetical protein
MHGMDEIQSVYYLYVYVCHGLYIIGWLGVSVAVGADLAQKGGEVLFTSVGSES